MKSKLDKIDAKLVIGLILTLVFSWLCIDHVISADQMVVIYTMIISFYFGSAIVDKNKNKEE